jgi:hypothetical protein
VHQLFGRNPACARRSVHRDHDQYKEAISEHQDSRGVSTGVAHVTQHVHQTGQTVPGPCLPACGTAVQRYNRAVQSEFQCHLTAICQHWGRPRVSARAPGGTGCTRTMPSSLQYSSTAVQQSSTITFSATRLQYVHTGMSTLSDFVRAPDATDCTRTNYISSNCCTVGQPCTFLDLSLHAGRGPLNKCHQEAHCTPQ